MAGDKEVNETSSVPTSNAPRAEPNAHSTRWQFVWRIVAILIGAVFIYAGVIKVLDPVGFAGDIENYKILPWPIGVRLAFYLPWLEIICGFALVFRRFYGGALVILLGLVVVFIGATVAAKARGIDITCGCFGHASKDLSFTWHMVLDLALLSGVIALFVRTHPRKEAILNSF